MSGPSAEAALLLQDAGGGINRSLDGGEDAQPMSFSVLGTAPGAHTRDQANFFFRDPPAAETGNALATVTPAVSSFTMAEVASYIAETGPLRIVSWNFSGADSPVTITSLKLTPRRLTPFGDEGRKDYLATTYLTADQFQDTRLNIPLAVTVDGYTGVQITNTANATPASYSLAVMFAASLDKRLTVPSAPPVAMRG